MLDHRGINKKERYRVRSGIPDREAGCNIKREWSAYLQYYMPINSRSVMVNIKTMTIKL